MEAEMRVSPSIVRKLRKSLGWSQEQMAIASGLSLRTVQRVEAQGVVSIQTRASLAATFSVSVSALAAEASAKQNTNQPRRDVGAFFLGVAVIACVMLNESGRDSGMPIGEALMAIDSILAVLAACVGGPALLRLSRQRQHAAVVLSILGVPLVVLLLGGLLHSLFASQAPSYHLLSLGFCGLGLTVMALQMFGVVPLRRYVL
ncbi:MAG: helix-turn-helix transcriptional regulator [Betaproteobacteria bacterium]